MFEATAPIIEGSLPESTAKHQYVSNLYPQIKEQSFLVPVLPLTNNKFQCPMCSNYLLPPIYQCYQGHSLCHECEPKVKKCPVLTCQSTFPKNKQKIRSFVVEEIVLGLKFNCRNHLFGCSVQNLEWNSFKEHQSTCSFKKRSYCKQLGLSCKVECTVESILEHLQYAHRIKGVNFDCEKNLIKIEQGVHERKLKGNELVCLTPNLLKCKDNIFIVRTKIEKKHASWMISMVGSGAGSGSGSGSGSDEDSYLARHFDVRMKLVPILRKRNSTSLSMEWSGEMGQLNTPFGHAECTFRVPLEALSMFAKRNDHNIVEWVLEVCLRKRSTENVTKIQPHDWD